MRVRSDIAQGVSYFGSKCLVGLPLTPRENEVLYLLSVGKSCKETANILGISHKTVCVHRQHMLVKLDADCTPHAVRIAFEKGILHVRDSTCLG